jgi:hypothetical protein
MTRIINDTERKLQINIAAIANGIYFLTINGDTEKVVIDKN